MTLLILDDDIQYAQLLSVVADNCGLASESFSSAGALFSRGIQSGDVLVLDLVMPRVDGIEVIRKLSDLEAKPSLVLISGFDARVLHSAQQLAEAHALQVVGTLTKPVSIDTFAEIIKQIDPHNTPNTAQTKPEREFSTDEIVDAVSQSQFIPYFQPQIDLQSKELMGVEVLCRWQHPFDGLVFPNQFIPKAEHFGLIGALTYAVLDACLKQVGLFRQNNINTRFSINVSPSDIKKLDFPEKLLLMCEKYEVPPQQLVLELTENAVMTELTTALDVLNRLRMRGFRLSIDDFGTGYSSLSHLYQAPFSELKIDKRFVSRLLEDEEARVIVKICVALAQMLNMDIVAEGIEEQAQLDALKELNCGLGQGFFISEALPANEFVNWYQQYAQ